MGVIKDGAISGRLPSDEAFVVHYPGYPSSVSRAVETLGGDDAIVNARSSKPNKLELRFRPEDPHSHPAFGRLYPCKNLLLRICRKKCRVDQNDDPGTNISNFCKESNPELCNVGIVQDYTSPEVKDHSPDDMQAYLTADIVARVGECYQFKGMADYQHVLPLQGDAGHRRKRRKTDVEGPIVKEDLAHRAADENIMALLPQLFSPKDLPETIVLRPSATISSKNMQEAVVTLGREREIEYSIAIGFDIQEIPKSVNWEHNLPKESDHWKLQMEVSKLFDERPIWPRASIIERLGDMGLKFNITLLKKLLVGTAYYFGNGPFQRFWIRKGYDPRKDPESRIYQRIEFRVPDELRGYCVENKRVKHRWDDICAFRVLPTKFQLHLQLFELSDDFIQQDIRKAPIETVCSPLTGWFSSDFLDCMRLCITVRFLSICDKPGAETLLKSKSISFEKSKRTRFQPNNFGICEKAELRVNQVDKKDASDDEDDDDDDNDDNDLDDGEDDHDYDNGEEEDDEDEDEDEDKDEGEDEDEDKEEENEEDEAEENEDNIEVDAAEEINVHPPPRLDVEKGNQLRKCSNSNAENFSEGYLQDLFVSFPSAESGSVPVQDEDADGEYEIYEQEGDSSDSDDDY